MGRWRRFSLAALAALPAAVIAWAAGTGSWAAFSATTTNPGNTFAAASFTPGSCASVATPLLVTGFEHGTDTTAGGGAFNTVIDDGDVAVNGSSARNGNYGLDLNDNNWFGTPSIEKDLSSGTQQLALRAYIRFPSLPGSDLPQVLHLERSPHAHQIDLNYVSATKKLTLSVEGGSTVTGSTVLAANTWYRIDLRVDARTGVSSAAWRIGTAGVSGTVQPTLTLPADTTNFYGLRFGPTGISDGLTWRAQYDDVLVTGTAGDYPLGNGKVLSLKPTGAGAINNPGDVLRTEQGLLIIWPPVDSTSWNLIDDDPMTSTAYFIYQGSADTSAYFTATFADVAAGTCVEAVSALAATSSQSVLGATSAKVLVDDGATTYTVRNGELGGPVEPLIWSLPLPSTGSAWTASELNALTMRIGYASLAISNAHWDALRFEYATT